MARITFSPLVVDARGSVSDTTFSSWKGRRYIRSRVVPANPQTADQVNQRTKLTHAVAHYQELNDDIKDRWGEYASPYQVSGYNSFCDANIPVQKHADALDPVYTPANPDVAGPSDAGAVTGGNAGEIDVTWTQGKEGAGIYVEVAVLKEGTTYYDTALTVKSHEAVLASVHAVTLTGLTAGAVYAVMVCTYDSNLSKDKFSQSYTVINVTAHA